MSTQLFDFDNIKASTKTFIIKTNLVLNIETIFSDLPITDYVIIPRRRGRKKKVVVEDPNAHIEDGSIITLEYENKHRGVYLKKKKKKDKTGRIRYFRNSTTVVMIIDKKIINFKLSRNGKFQMTGCKSMTQAEKCVSYIWKFIENTNMCEFEDEKFTALFVPSMRNIDFDIGFNINREALDHFINTETTSRSLLETSIGYTGVNIKKPFDKNILEMKIVKKVWSGDKFLPGEYVPYINYIETEKEKDRKKKLDKKRYTTFLVFHSGKIIMSCISKEFGRDPFNYFINIMIDNRGLLEEKLDI